MGTRLAEVLEEQGRRRDWLARQTGVDPSLVTRVAQGSRRPSPAFRARAAEVLGVAEADLFPDSTAAAPA